jgi:signal transduction histidine kinase
MDIDRIVDSSLSFLLILILFSATDIAVFMVFRSLIPENTTYPALFSSLIVCWGFILVYNPIRERVLKGIQFLFRRYHREPVRSMERLSACLAGVISPADACTAFRGFLLAEFGAHDVGVKILVMGSNEVAKEITVGTCFPPLPAQLPDRPVFLHQLSVPGLEPGLDDAVFVPLSRAVCGYVILDRKDARILYSGAELSLLRVLAGEFSLRIQTVLANERADQANRAVQHEKERIARDIHDGLGSALSMSLLLISKIELPNSDGRLVQLQQLIDGSLSELRTLVWTMSEDADCASLADIIRTRLLPPLSMLGFACSLEIADTVELVPLGSVTRMNLFRIAQEFLTNCAKHQSPGLVSIRFSRQESNLVCRFRCSSQPMNLSVVSTNLSGGMGMDNIVHRARDIGARLLLDDSETARWNFDLILPITEADYI